MIEKKVIMIAGYGALFIVMLMGFVSCRDVQPRVSEEQLQKRVAGFIESRINRDLKAMQHYYLDPSDARIGNINYLKSEIKGIEIHGKLATVELANDFMVMGFTFRKTPQKMIWKWHEDNWYVETGKNVGPFDNGKNAKKQSK